jgi:hypothetical protein
MCGISHVMRLIIYLEVIKFAIKIYNECILYSLIYNLVI